MAFVIFAVKKSGLRFRLDLFRGLGLFGVEVEMLVLDADDGSTSGCGPRRGIHVAAQPLGAEQGPIRAVDNFHGAGSDSGGVPSFSTATLRNFEPPLMVS